MPYVYVLRLAGDYTVNNAFELLPFANTLVALEMTGGEIVDVLNIAATMALSGASSGAYPYASGLRYDVDGNDLDAPISNVEVNVRLAGNWTPLLDDEVYTVVTNNFISAGGDGYTTFAEIDDVTDLFLEYANTFVRYAQEQGTLVDPPLEEYSTQSFIPSDDATAGPTSAATPAVEGEDPPEPTAAPAVDEGGDEPTATATTEAPAATSRPPPEESGTDAALSLSMAASSCLCLLTAMASSSC